MKIAVIGSGIAGMSAAHFLSPGHEVVMFEKNKVLGGHTATVDVPAEDGIFPVDTGFIVFNRRTYPLFNGLLDELGVRSQPSSMSLSVMDEASGLEYAGSSLNGLFAQRRNLIAPSFLGMLKDILRFNRQAAESLNLASLAAQQSLGDYLARHHYGRAFRDYYLIPMGAAIWSASHEDMLKIPLGFFLRFFRNHGLLQLRDRPQWRVIEGGSRQYIGPLTASYAHNIRLNCPVRGVHRQRRPDGAFQVLVDTSRGMERFDGIVFACHSDQALALLKDPCPREQRILGAIPYRDNEVVLHRDTSILPRRRRCWSSWNVQLGAGPEDLPRLTYNMNILQGLESRETYCVSLNQGSRIDPDKVLGVYHYQHPVFSLEGIAAQQRWGEINGKQATWYCGAYWRNGFHEDGVWSARRVADAIGTIPWREVA